MTLVLPNAAEELMLHNWLNKTAPQDCVLKLYKNNITPGEADTEATYQEADFSGYAPLPLTGAGWSTTPGAPSAASFAEQTFQSNANQALQNIYGYSVVEVTSGKIKWAERIPTAPWPVQNNGDQIRITPNFTQE